MRPLRPAAPSTVAEALAEGIVALGVRQVFGVSGGGVAHIWAALEARPSLRLIHTQHESGAAFAAAEASLATDAPVVVFATTGPGLTNLLTGLVAARQEGAQVLAVTGLTPAERRGRGATQETSPQALWSSLFAPGAVFDLAETLEHPAQLPVTLARLAEGLGRAGGFVAHISVPAAQRRWTGAHPLPRVETQPLGLGAAAAGRLAEDLLAGTVRLVVGYEARHVAAKLPELARRLSARVVVTPRAKGVFPESHPRCAGVIGFAGHTDADLAGAPSPRRVLCLGTRLGEGASQWSGALSPAEGGRMVIVHPRGDVAGAYPGAAQQVLIAPVEQVVDALLSVLPPAADSQPLRPQRRLPPRRATATPGTVHPVALMAAVQEVVIDGSEAVVMASSGNAFAWGIRHLRFEAPRWRVSVGWGSMGHCTSGAVGIAATGRPVVALVGDGAMLMMNEVATAARHRLAVVWVVLVDGRYGMCAQGTAMSGLSVDCELARVDFAAWGRSLGAHGVEVSSAAALRGVLRAALRRGGPVVVAVQVDRHAQAPIGRRVAALTFHEEIEP